MRRERRPAPRPVDDGLVGAFRQAKHPGAAFFHVLFKAAALFVYLFSGWFTSNFVFVFVVCVLMLAFDFWTVKV